MAEQSEAKYAIKAHFASLSIFSEIKVSNLLVTLPARGKEKKSWSWSRKKANKKACLHNDQDGKKFITCEFCI